MGTKVAAYRLQETDAGWAWRVVDGRGVTIAAGVAPDKPAARAAIRRQRRLGAAGAAELGRPDRGDLVRALLAQARARLFGLLRIG